MIHPGVEIAINKYTKPRISMSVTLPYYRLPTAGLALPRDEAVACHAFETTHHKSVLCKFFGLHSVAARVVVSLGAGAVEVDSGIISSQDVAGKDVCASVESILAELDVSSDQCQCMTHLVDIST